MASVKMQLQMIIKEKSEEQRDIYSKNIEKCIDSMAKDIRGLKQELLEFSQLSLSDKLKILANDALEIENDLEYFREISE